MLATRVACPHCKTVLRSSKPLRLGKQLTCLKCHQVFVVSAEAQQEAAAVSEGGSLILPPEALEALRTTAMPPSAAGSANGRGHSGFSASQERPIITLPKRRRSRLKVVLAFAVLLLFLGGGIALAVVCLQDDPAEPTPEPDKTQARKKDNPPEPSAEADKAARKTEPKPTKVDEPVASRVPAEKKRTPKNAAPKEPPAVAPAPPERKKADVARDPPRVDPAIRPAVATVGIDPRQITQAIDKGVEYLKKSLPMSGTWLEEGDEHAVGYAALPALALLECQVAAADPVIQRAATFVRSQAPKSVLTYDLGLAILLLDRLGDAKDKKLIRTLAARLMAGQGGAGGWDYKCPLLPDAESDRLLTYLHKHRPKVEILNPIAGQANPPKVRTNKEPPKADELPARVRDLPIVVQQRLQSKELRFGGRDDNSNTQFGLLGLWAARRHDIAVELSLELAARRFRDTQNGNGGWGYVTKAPSKNSMTCVGLLGLAMGHGAAAEAFLASVKGKETPLPSLEDEHIKAALATLSQYINRDDETKGLESRTDLYYLWTLERVGMLYRQPTFGNKDWYRWGCEIILPNQRDDGSWQDHYGKPIDTAFALLFLRRSNLVRDLTDNLNLYLAIPRPEAAKSR